MPNAFDLTVVKRPDKVRTHAKPIGASLPNSPSPEWREINSHRIEWLGTHLVVVAMGSEQDPMPVGKAQDFDGLCDGIDKPGIRHA